MCDKTFKTSSRKLKYMRCSSKKWRAREENYYKIIRLYLTGDMTSLYSFSQGSLEWPINESFSSDVSWN